MKVEDVVNKLKAEQLLDQQGVYTYASSKKVIGGMLGSIKGAVLLSVSGNTLYIHRANPDNTYGECLDKIEIANIRNTQGQAGLFGGKFSFEYCDKKYKFQLPSRANSFVDYFDTPTLST